MKNNDTGRNKSYTILKQQNLPRNLAVHQGVQYNKREKTTALKDIHKESKKNVMQKSPILYICLLSIWTILTVILWYFFINSFIDIPFFAGIKVTTGLRVFTTIILVANAIFITYFWLNGVKDFLYVIWYYSFKHKLIKRYYAIIDTDVSKANDKILFVYCTCNDFDAKSLAKSMNQKYHNFDTVILDDSTDEQYKAAIDAFAATHNIKVVRRADRVGFKSGNINHYLMSEECKQKEYDYFVILDADEILPENYIIESLKYFYAKENIGIVQSNHIATRNRNFFMKLFHVGVNSHWPTYQIMKHFYGFSTMLGHGAMIKKDCYYAGKGGFPNLVAEDLCLSIEARKYGYFVAFAPNIICEEEYPIDYVAFKKRHSKWTQGNLEFIKKYSGKIAKSNMKWYEKMDIVLFTYNLPLTAVFALFIFLNLIIIPILHVDISKVYALWMTIPTIIFFFAPMLNDFFSWIFRLNPFRNIFYSFCVIILYGSMLTTSFISALLGMFGKKAKFIVTPKSSQKISPWFALKCQWPEILFSSILLLISIFVAKNILAVILIVLTGYLSYFLLFFSNRKYNTVQTKKIDEKTAKISLSSNKVYLYNKKLDERYKTVETNIAKVEQEKLVHKNIENKN